MPFCTNPDCPHKQRTDTFAEYQDDINQCPECGSILINKNVRLSAEATKVKGDLAKKVFITIGLLAVLRLLLYIPIPGVDMPSLPGENLKDVSGIFSHGSLSIAALGIMPFITACFLVEFFSLIMPPLKRWRKEKHDGRRKLNITAMLVTVLLSVIQGISLSNFLEKGTGFGGAQIVPNSGLDFKIIFIATLTAGVFIYLWIAGQISKRGIGNGISMVILCGILFGFLHDFDFIISSSFLHTDKMEGTVSILVSLAIFLLAVAFSFYMENKEFNIKVKKDSRLIDLPFKYNTAGIIPATIAISFVMLPVTIMNFTGSYPDFFESFQPGNPFYFITGAAITVLLFFFFTSLYFNPTKILNFLKSKNAEPVIPNNTTFDKLLAKKNTRFAALSALYISVYLFLPNSSVHLVFIISSLAIIKFAAILLDLTYEIKARRKYGYFVKIDELQKPYEAKFIKNLLEQNNIKCFLEGYYHRSLYYFFGPFIPISIYVEQDKEAEALKIISD